MSIEINKYVIIFIALFLFLSRCSTKAYPEERINIDKSFLAFFNLFTLSDTLIFQNGSGKEKKIIISGIDSSKLNTKGWLINGGQHNRYTCRFREIGSDTLKLIRENEVSVSKAPESNLNGFFVQFGNLFFNDTLLPNLHRDTIVLGKKVVSKYYLIKTVLTSTDGDDVEELYISRQTGFLGFKTHSGEVWVK